MNCPQCGAGLLPSAQFCGACGFRIAQMQQPQANDQQQPSYNAQSGSVGNGGGSSSGSGFNINLGG